MGVKKQTPFWITVVCLVVFLEITFSERSTWIKSMQICAVSENRASSEEDTVNNNTWIGKARYNLGNGTLILRVERVEKNKTCSDADCASFSVGCEFCARPAQLNDSILPLELLIKNLTPGKKYIMGDFSRKFIREIPTPAECLAQKGDLDTEYIACNNYFEYGCRRVEKQSEIKITISVSDVGSSSEGFEDCCSEGTKLFGNGSTKLERIQMIWLLINGTLIPVMFLIV